MSTILRRIEEGIDAHRTLAEQEPDFVVLGEAAFVDLIEEGSPYTFISSDPAEAPASVHGIPIKVLLDLPRDYVGILGGV